MSPCEVCGVPATHTWGMDLTPLCDQHYNEAEDRYEAAVERAR